MNLFDCFMSLSFLNRFSFIPTYAVDSLLAAERSPAEMNAVPFVHQMEAQRNPYVFATEHIQ